MDIFKKTYTLRTFGKTEFVDGYPQTPYSDRVERLDVQPLSATEVMALPEGLRRTKNVRAIGRVDMKAADDAAGIPGDRLFYRGQWYECTGSDAWGNTPIGQTEAVFGLVPAVEGESALSPLGTGGGTA